MTNLIVQNIKKIRHLRSEAGSKSFLHFVRDLGQIVKVGGRQN